jgi:hypothetical protein
VQKRTDNKLIFKIMGFSTEFSIERILLILDLDVEKIGREDVHWIQLAQA